MFRTASRRLTPRGAIVSLGFIASLALVASARIAPLAGAEPAMPRAADAFDDHEGRRLTPAHALEGLQLRIDSLKEELRAPQPEDPGSPRRRLANGADPDAPLPREFDPDLSRAGIEVRP